MGSHNVRTYRMRHVCLLRIGPEDGSLEPKHVANCVLMIMYIYGDRGSTVVKVLRYKSEGLWFGPSWCHWNF